MAFATRVSGDEFEELIRSKLKIFLSVDVVGSTALKQKGRVYEVPEKLVDYGSELANGDWLNFITNFYKDFPSKLIDAFEEIRKARSRESKGEGRKAKPPVLWKALGDELVFTAELMEPVDASIHLEALANAINSSVKFWSEGNTRIPVSFKGTAWLGGFPVGNSEIPLIRPMVNDEAGNKAIGDDFYDYSGPAIDIGFRIARFSTPRRLIVSAELADLVVSDRRLEKKFRAEPPTELKGVLRGRPYPIFWFDCYSTTQEVGEKSLAQKEDQMLQKSSLNGDLAKTYLETWFKTIDDYYLRPFIASYPAHLDLVPKNYPAMKEKVVDQLKRIYLPAPKESTETVSPTGDAKVDKLKETNLPPTGSL